jgi:hypothetical protein
MNKKVTGRIVFGVALAALILCPGCQAKDYSERIGPYEVSFSLPDNIASETNLNETIIRNISADGISYDTYGIGLQTKTETQAQAQGIDQTYNGLLITHYNKTKEIDFAALTPINARIGGNTCNTAHQIIDGRDGIIVKCYGSDRSEEDYHFTYQLNNRTIVDGVLSSEWDSAVQPILESLHVKEVD